MRVGLDTAIHMDEQTSAAVVFGAAAAVDDYVAWIEANMSSMTATVGVGKENYDWVRTVLTKALA